MQIFRYKYPYVNIQKNLLRRTYLAAGQGIFTATINFDVTADETYINIADRPVFISININVDELTEVQTIVARSILFNISMSQDQSNFIVAEESMIFNTQLTYDVLNQLLGNTDITFGVNQDHNILNQLIAETNITLDANLSLDLVSQLAAIADINFNISLDTLYEASGAGIVDASITFLANLAQIQTNTITIDKAFSLVMNLAINQNTQLDANEVLTLLIQVAQNQSAQRGIPDNIAFDTELTQDQINLATRVGLLTFNTALGQATETQLNYNLFINLASSLALQINTDNEVLVFVDFDVTVGQQEIVTKDISEAITLALETDYQTEIHLIARGNISFTNQMEQLQELQMLGQSEITFGHLLGLASIGSADLGESISFATVQDFNVDGFIIQFTITTPENRTLKVYVEDRTTIVDELERTIIVGRPN